MYGRHQADGAVRLRAGPRLHDHPAVRLCHLGADPGGNGRAVQGNRRGERLFPDADSGKPAAEGSGARGRLRAGSCVGDKGRHGRAAGAAGRAADERNHFLLHVLQVGADMARSPDDV